MDSDAEIIGELFARAVPEIAEGRVKIVAVSREPGLRSKVAIQTLDGRLDSVAACVGVRGNRIKQVVNALNGERIDLVLWNEDPKVLIANALQPADVQAVVLDEVQHRATVFVSAEQQALVLGRRGINQRLAGNLCGYDRRRGDVVAPADGQRVATIHRVFETDWSRSITLSTNGLAARSKDSIACQLIRSSLGELWL